MRILTAEYVQELIDNLYGRAERDETGKLWAEVARLEDLRLSLAGRV